MMKTTFVTMLALGTWPLISTAMPTKAELDKVSPVVADLMRPEQEALKAGKKSKSEVAAIALELVAKADGEAAKLLLTKGAYNLYVRDGDFDKAIATLKSFREIVPDMEPQYLANIIESSLRTISRKNGGQLYRLLDETRTIARYRGELKKLETQAKKTPSDKSLQLKLAEHYAVLNDWAKALDAFELSSDRNASDVAKMEKANAKAQKVAADFWWNYPVRKVPEFEKPFRQHAAKLYEQAIASGELVGLNKVQADRRIEEAKVFGETAFQSVADDVSIDGLVHLWNFNDGFNDCVSGYVPSVQGDVTIKNGVCTLGSDGGKVGLRTVNGLLGNGTFTLEAWYTENARTYGTRALFANGNGMGMMWASGCGQEGYFSFDRQNPGRGTQDMQFELGHKTYLAITHVKDSQQVVAYKYDTVTKSFVSVKADVERAIPMFNSGIVLGESCNKNTARASYDEVRLWKRCLTSREVERSAKAGPNALNDSVVRIRTSSSIGKQKEKSFAKVKREMEETVAAQHEDKLYCVIDLSGGPNAKRYPVSYLNAVPKGGWTDEYKTTKLVLRRIEPGKFILGDSVHNNKNFPKANISLSKGYYLGVFEVTQRQWELVSGTRPSWFSTAYAMRPVEAVSFEMIRGDEDGSKWPTSGAVDKESFMGLLRAKSGVRMDLPTEAQWEYACRAGTSTDYNNGKNCLGNSWAEAASSVARSWENGWNLEKWGMRNAGMGTWEKIVDKDIGPEFCTAVVGTYAPNSWGLYDMHGNVKELCLDWRNDIPADCIDPKGARIGEVRVCRGGCWRYQADGCTSFSRTGNRASARYADTGFRLAIQPPFVQQEAIDGSAQSPDTSIAKAKREMEEKIAVQREDKLYCVIDLSGGPNAKRYPVSYLNTAPKTGWSDEYKTTKLVLRKIKPGKEPLGRYVITNGYYIGVFEVTQRQWELVCGKNPSEFVNPMHPVEMVSYGMIRGTSLGDAWVRTIDEGTFVGNMRHRAGLKFDLPVEKQWEYACRAGTVSSFNNGGNDIDDLLKLGKFEGNGGRTEHHSQVGSFVPNAWGIYDMHGNVRECCLDWTSSSQHISRGGNFLNHFNECTSTFRGHSMSHDGVRNYVGFRLVVLP